MNNPTNAFTFRSVVSSVVNSASRTWLYFARIMTACLAIENCRICKKELSLSLTHDSVTPANTEKEEEEEAELPPETTRFGQFFEEISKIVCTHAAYPAILARIDLPFFVQQFSQCLCIDCWFKLEINDPLIRFCKLKSSSQGRLPIVSGAAYENSVRDLIGKFKYDGDQLLAVDLCYVMLNGWSTLRDRIPASDLLLVPVPLHKHRLRNRGFNQSELLAVSLSSITGIKNVNAISRRRHTRPQQTLDRQERLNNVKGAFKANGKYVKGKNIILVDDVFTSGATLVECAEELLHKGAMSVVAITVAGAVLWGKEQKSDVA